MNILFLYTELADYVVNCCKELAKKGKVHIVRWPVNKEAPFQFDFGNELRVYEKDKYTFEELNQLIVTINPSIIICSGWIDKDYLKLVKPYFKKIPTVITLDTKWTGSLKQHAASVLSRAYITNRFSHIWVPGKAQSLYASKLGFSNEQIRTGFYCCSLERFNQIYNIQFEKKEKNFPKRFLYVGRYYDFKGVNEMWEAFVQLSDEIQHEWELWCLGTGSVEPRQHPKIKHFGFVQPADLAQITEQCGVFILPSRFEPWGVVVQEYAASGFPLLLSREVGANESFLEEGKNGFLFDKEKIEGIKNVFKKMLSLEHHQLTEMAKHSHLLAQKIDPVQWANTVSELVNGFKKK